MAKMSKTCSIFSLDVLAKEQQFTTTATNTKVVILSDAAEPQEPGMFGSYLQNVFNSKNKQYLTIVEKTLKGILEFSDAFSKLSSV